MKIPNDQLEQKKELILFIVESTEKIKQKIAYLEKSMNKFPNAPLTNSSSNKKFTTVNNPAAPLTISSLNNKPTPLTISSPNNKLTPVNNPAAPLTISSLNNKPTPLTISSPNNNLTPVNNPNNDTARNSASRNAAAKKAKLLTPANNEVNPKVTSASNPTANNAVAINAAISEEKESAQQKSSNSPKIIPLSQNDENLYFGIIDTLKKLNTQMNLDVQIYFNKKRKHYEELNASYKKRKMKGFAPKLNPSKQDIGSVDFTKLIELFLIIQKLRGKLENKSNNSTKLDSYLKNIIKDYIYKIPEGHTFDGNIRVRGRQFNALKNTGSESELKELKEKIGKEKDENIKKKFNKIISQLFKDYIDGKKFILMGKEKMPQLIVANNNNNNNNKKSNANTVVGVGEQNNLNDELAEKEKSKVSAVPPAIESHFERIIVS